MPKLSKFFSKKGKASITNKNRASSSKKSLKQSFMNVLSGKKTRKLINQPPHPTLSVSIKHEYGPNGGIIYKCMIKNKTTKFDFYVFSDEDLEKIRGELKKSFPGVFTKQDLNYIDIELFRKKKELNTIVKWKSKKNRTKTTRGSTFNRTIRLNKRVPNPLTLDNPYLLNPKYFDKHMTPLSSIKDSASDSMVYLIKTRAKLRYSFILKITYVDEDRIYEDNYPGTEFKIYEVMNDLIKYDITPYVFRGVSKIDTFKIGEIEDEDLKSDLQISMNASQYDYVFAMLNETSSDENNDIKSLHSFIQDKISYVLRSNTSNKSSIKRIEHFLGILNTTLFIIIFQVMYTLCVFNRIKLTHNDLHQGNIMLVINKKNIFSSDFEVRNCNKFIFFDSSYNQKELYLPDIGIEARIYDFDRSCKNGATKKYPEIKCRFYDKDYGEYRYCKDNKYRDSFKFLSELYYKINSQIIAAEPPKNYYIKNQMKDIKDFIESLFTNKRLLEEGKNKNGEFINSKFREKRLFHLIKEPTDEDEMLSTKEIVLELVKKMELDKNHLNLDVLNTFDIRDCSKI